MVAIDPSAKKYIIRFKPKDQRQNKSDDKVEIFRAIVGIADTNNKEDVVKPASLTRTFLQNFFLQQTTKPLGYIQDHMYLEQ